MFGSRVAHLLVRARQTRSLRTSLARGGQDPAEVDLALERLYTELGRALVEELGDDGSGWDDVIEAVRRIDPDDPIDGVDDLSSGAAEGDDASEPTVLLDAGPVGEDDADVDDLDDLDGLDGRAAIDGRWDTAAEIDASTPVIPPEREFRESEEPSDYVVVTAAAVGVAREADAENPFAQIVRGEPLVWRRRLDELMALLELPTSFADGEALGVEASRVQWATGDLPARLRGIPAEVRCGVVALLAARAQHLRQRLDVDVGPRVSLDRLQRYRIDEDLPSVPGLQPTPRPERGTWENDARIWYALLRGGGDRT